MEEKGREEVEGQKSFMTWHAACYLPIMRGEKEREREKEMGRRRRRRRRTI